MATDGYGAFTQKAIECRKEARDLFRQVRKLLKELGDDACLRVTGKRLHNIWRRGFRQVWRWARHAQILEGALMLREPANKRLLLIVGGSVKAKP